MPPLVAIWPIMNATSQHIDDQMLTLLSSIETALTGVIAKRRFAVSVPKGKLVVLVVTEPR